MELNFYTLSVIYLVYSFLGWVGETVVATAKGRRFTNRGVASGPFCFVYGTAGVLLAVGLADLRSSWFALFAPAATPKAVVDKLAADARTVVQSAAFKQKAQEQGATADYLGPAQLAERVKTDLASWADVVKSSKIEAE